MQMRDVDHTNPYTNAPFGPTFHSNQAVAADGGRESTEETMADVSHEPPNEGATRAFERGTEGRDETV